MRRLLAPLLAIACLSTPVGALDGNYSILTSTSTGLAVGMNLYLPPGYDRPRNAGRKYPLMVFLGGAGERGDPTDAEVVLQKSTVWGPSKEIRDSDRDFPFVVVTPISSEWYSSLPNEYDAMVEYLKATIRVDPDRVYFTGACAGASGVMEFSQVHPRQLAAMIPCLTHISTVRNPERLQEIPTWFFHGFADASVSREQTITWANAIANSFGQAPISCMDTYPYGTAPDGSQTYNADNQTGAFRPGADWDWTKYTRPVDDSLLLFTLMSTDLHNVWHYAVTNDTVLHWMAKQRRQASFAGTPAPLPGRIEAEDFDVGGHLRAYSDATVDNTGDSRMRDTANPYDGDIDHEQVDLADGGSGAVLTDTVAGEWLEYTVNASSGTYALGFRVSAPADGGSLRLLRADGSVVAGPLAVPATTGFTTIAVNDVQLASGVQTLRLVVDQGGFDLDWFEVSQASGAAGVIAFTSSSYSAGEGGGSVMISVQRTGGSDGAVSVNYGTVSGSATASDYINASGTLTWGDGDTSLKTFTVTIIQDALVEGDESLTLSLANPTNSAGVGGPSALTIADDDAAANGVLQFSATTFRQVEADAGTSLATITVTCTGGTTSSVGITWTSSDGTATAGDYVAGTGTLTFGPGETSKTFSVTIMGDGERENDETVRLVLSNPTGGATLGTQDSASLIIVTDDGPGPGGTSDTPDSHRRSCGGGSAFALLIAVLACAASGLVPRSRGRQ